MKYISKLHMLFFLIGICLILVSCVVKPAASANNSFSSTKALICSDNEINYRPYINQLNEITKSLLDSYVQRTKHVNYKNSNDFKYQLCGTKVENAYTSSRSKYFVSNISNVNKQGRFYWGLLWNSRSSSIVNAIGQCESGYNPNAKSPDGGYGIFQITPAAIGDKSIVKSKLLQPAYNTEYGLYHMNKFFKLVQQKYEKYNTSKNIEFDWQMMTRAYNGGFKQIDNVIKKSPSNDPLKYIFTGDFISSSKLSGRFVCFEKVNVAYPLKIQLTSDTLMQQKSF